MYLIPVHINTLRRYPQIKTKKSLKICVFEVSQTIENNVSIFQGWYVYRILYGLKVTPCRFNFSTVLLLIRYFSNRDILRDQVSKIPKRWVELINEKSHSGDLGSTFCAKRFYTLKANLWQHFKKYLFKNKKIPNRTLKSFKEKTYFISLKANLD